MSNVEIVESVSVQALAAINRIEIDTQIATAKQWPREIAKIQRNVLDTIQSSQEIAEKCFYNLPRGGGVKGPSVRLAELFLAEYGNMRIKTRLVEEGTTSVTCAADIYDLEKNIAYSCEARKAIMTSAKRGEEPKRFGEDMITTTINATASVAFRNAVFKVIPGIYIREAYETARKVAVGDIKSLKERTAKCLQTFAKIDVTQIQVLEFLGLQSIADINTQHLEDLIGVYNSIKDGETTIEEVFVPMEKQRKGKPSVDDLKSQPAPEVEFPDSDLFAGREPGSDDE